MMKKITLLILLLLAFGFSYGQSIFENPITGTNPSAFNPYTTGQVVDANITASGIGMGSGVTARNDNDEYDTSAYNVVSLDNTKYLEFTLTPNSGYEIDFVNFVYASNTTGTGPTNFAFRSSLDGYTSNIGTPSATGTTIDLSAATFQDITSSITFRIYAWGASSTAGRFSIEDFIFNGVVSALPCSGATVTWNAGAWTPTPPNINTPAIIIDDYDTNTDGSFSACTLTVNGGFSLNVNDGDYVEIENDVTVDGNLTVQTQGNFIQNNDAATFTDNSTNGVSMNKTKNVANKFVYTYWSSPINNGIIENVFSSVPVDKRFEFIAANFVDLEEEIGNTNTFLPNAGVDDIDDNGDDWGYASGALVPGVGYAMRTNTIGPAFPRTETFPFIGEFNNGIVSVTLVNNSGGQYNDWNLIGNPYPCAIDADQFFTVNAGIVDAIYLWDQFTAPDINASGNEGYNFSGADYAIINGSGTVSNGASGTIPNRFVPSGQGFFVEALSASNVTFNNSMRLITNDNSQFFKGKSSKSSALESANKLWVNLTSDNGASNQILVSYIDGATNLNDGSFYDLKRPVSTGNKALLYTLIENDNGKFAIQGKASNSLNTNEIIKLGFKTTIDVATIYKLSIAQFEGDFLQNNTVYLKDNLTNTVHNLSNESYSFTSELGEFNARFEIAFSASVLSNNSLKVHANTIKIVQLDTNNIQFTTETSAFKSITIYDLLGRGLYKLDGKNTTETYNLNTLKSSVYIANIELENGATLSKKFIKN